MTSSLKSDVGPMVMPGVGGQQLHASLSTDIHRTLIVACKL